MIPYTNQMKNEIYDIETRRTYSKKNGTSYHKYCNDILTFDIEVSSAWIENGKIVPYRKGLPADYWNELEQLSLCYIWQFSFNDKVYYGRELRDFEKVLKDLPDNIEIVIRVHNLSYEFHFLNNFLEWKSVFAKSPHKPMKCVSRKYPNIEFRCSYMLTRLSLDSWGKQIGLPKATGDLDYEALRTPLTELTETELGYCQRDCEVVYEGIKIYKEKYGNIRDIPLTQTGTVRRVVKDLLTSNPEYVKNIKKLVPKSAEEYQTLMQVFAGGYTHANRKFSGRVQRGHIEHYDFASSYPTVMISEKYPSNPWTYAYLDEIPDDETFENYAYILKLKFTKIATTTCNTYIQSSKCEFTEAKFDNGRIISAKELIITCTEQDYLTIRDSYEWEGVEILDSMVSRKKYLPKPFVEYVLQLYNNKTTLKGVEGQEDLYMQSKQYINSMFGMCVTAIVQPNVEFDGKEWSVSTLDRKYVESRLDKLRSWAPREKRYFLSYSWGCWVTAYARRNLWRCVIDCDSDCLYCDTDSIFVLGHHNFDWYNEEITSKLKKACYCQGIDFALTRPKTIKGKEMPLGLFDAEDSCSEFITLGAKRYVERNEETGKLKLTVSGINKSAVELLDDDIENFVDGFEFDKDADCVEKRLATYLTDMPEVVYPDGYKSTYKEGINMRRTGYLLTMTTEYKKLIQYFEMTIDDIDEDAMIRFHRSFV